MVTMAPSALALSAYVTAKAAAGIFESIEERVCYLPPSPAEKRGKTFPAGYTTSVVGCVVVSRKESERPAREESAEETSEYCIKFLALVMVRCQLCRLLFEIVDEITQEIDRQDWLAGTLSGTGFGESAAHSTSGCQRFPFALLVSARSKRIHLLVLPSAREVVVRWSQGVTLGYFTRVTRTEEYQSRSKFLA